jgi:hypothetical protein
VITGTGRTGTTFLVALLTDLGLDTGFKPGPAARIREVARAGLEHDVRAEDCPYIAKNPWFCDHAQSVLDRDDIVIDHVFVPMRDLEAAAESRRRVSADFAESLQGETSQRRRHMPGGLWHTNSSAPGDQEAVLLEQVYKLMLVMSGTTVPVTLLRYPRLVNDPAYVFEKLKPILGDITFEQFETSFRKTARPELVNSFNRNDR